MSSNGLNTAGKYMFMGTQLAITVAIGAYLGKWLDENQDTAPTFLLICSFTFGIIGFYQFIKQANRSSEDGNN